MSVQDRLAVATFGYRGGGDTIISDAVLYGEGVVMEVAPGLSMGDYTLDVEIETGVSVELAGSVVVDVETAPTVGIPSAVIVELDPEPIVEVG